MTLTVSNINVSLGKPEKQILHDVSFSLGNSNNCDGGFLSLLGPSGAGKSTLLKVLAGTLTPSSGSILLDGQDLLALPPHKRNLGFVYQDIRLFPHMTVAENVEFGLKVRGVSKSERALQASTMLERVQLAGFEKRYPRELSGGQAQRVALARTLVCKPRVLLLDEPFSGLDELLRDDMRSLVLGLHRELNLATIMVTHDAIEALELSDSIVYLDHGRVLQQGNPHELFESPNTPEVAASFGDSSTLRGRIENGTFVCANLRLPLSALGPNASDPSNPSTPVASTIIRYGATSLTEHVGWICVGEIPVRCGVYRGQDSLTRFELDGQVLTVPTAEVKAPSSTHKVYVNPTGAFVYPLATF